MTEGLLDPPPPSMRAAFLKKGRVFMDLAQASVALSVELDGRRCRRARVAAGSVGPTTCCGLLSSRRCSRVQSERRDAGGGRRARDALGGAHHRRARLGGLPATDCGRVRATPPPRASDLTMKTLICFMLNGAAAPRGARQAPTSGCSTWCARSSASPAPRKAAAPASAARAPCCSMDAPVNSCLVLARGGRWRTRHHGRGLARGRHAARRCSKTFVEHAASNAVLLAGHDHGRQGAARRRPGAVEARHPRGALGQPVPLHRLRADPRGGDARGERLRKGAAHG